MNMITTFFKGLFQPKRGILFIGNEGRGGSKIVPPEGIVYVAERITEKVEIEIVSKND
jgi:hypothetical protein